MRDIQDQSTNDKAGFEQKIRSLQEQNKSLQDDVDEGQARLSDQDRQYKYQLNQVETKRAALQKTVEELQNDLESLKGTVHVTQDRLSQREIEVGNLETEILRLKAKSGDSDTLNVIKRELTEQVAHIRKLESSNREQAGELKKLRKVHKSVEVVEEQKKTLETELQVMKDVQRELDQVQIQKQMLEDERRSWTSLLQREGQEDEFDSPEAVARALLRERIENASLVDKVGKLVPELSEKDEVIQNLTSAKANLQKETEKSRPSITASSDNKARLRLERQRALALKEVEYLRAQLKTFDTEETTMFPEDNHFDAQKAKQIQDLENLVDKYRNEIQTLHDDLSKAEQPAAPSSDNQNRGTKRSLEDDDEESERIGLLSRKNRKLQNTLTTSQQQATLLQIELDATKSQLNALQTRSRTRILELRSNPTADAEAVKQSTLTALRAENAALLSQLQNAHLDVKVVPISTLDNMKLDLQEMEKVVAEKEKRMRRLKEIWSAKSLEFREAVASVLGYKMDFMPNGRVRVTSMFDISGSGTGGSDGVDSGVERSIIFDGENGTMKISGGPKSLFALEIRDLIKFWVEERKEIPCFLAAMTLEFYERTTRAARM